MLILSGILDAQTQMSVSEKCSHTIRIWNSNTVANTLSALFTHVCPLRRIGAHTGQKNYTKFSSDLDSKSEIKQSISIMEEHGK